MTFAPYLEDVVRLMIVHGSYLMQIRSIQSQFSGLITPDRTESTEVLKLLYRLTLNYLELLVSSLVLFPKFGPFRNALPSRSTLSRGWTGQLYAGRRPGFCPRHGS